MRKTVPSDVAIEAVVNTVKRPEISLEILQTAFKEGRVLHMGTIDVIFGFILFVPVVSNSAFVELRFCWVHPESRQQGVLEALLKQSLFKFRKHYILTIIPRDNAFETQARAHGFQIVKEWFETPHWCNMLPDANKKHHLFWRIPTSS